MEFEDHFDIIFKKITDGSGGGNYYDLVLSLDMGIECILLGFNNPTKYRIIDEKKWFLSKIKYGI